MTNRPGSGDYFYNLILMVVLSPSYFLCVGHNDWPFWECTSTPCGCPLHLTFYVSGMMTQPSWEWCVLPQPTWWLFSHYFILCFEHNDSIILGGACTPIIHLGQSFSCCDLPLVICLSWRWHVPLVTPPHPGSDAHSYNSTLFVHLILFMFQAWCPPWDTSWFTLVTSMPFVVAFFPWKGNNHELPLTILGYA